MTKRPDLPRLEWKRNPRTDTVEPRHRVTWTENGKRKERTIKLDWQGDNGRLLELYWRCEAGNHPVQAAERKPARTWGDLVKAWQADPKPGKKKLAASTMVSYRREMAALLEKNEHKPVADLTRADLRSVHIALADTPRKADWRIQIVSVLWNYGRHKLDWPLGDNPAAGWDLYGVQNPFEPWPEWMVKALESAPERVRTAANLILGRGERPGAAMEARWDDFDGEWMMVRDEKEDESFPVFCPPSLSAYLATLTKSGAYVLARNLTEAATYSVIEKDFRKWRDTLGERARPYSLHGLRKLAIVQLAEAGCSDAEIQSITNQSAETVAYYRKKANRKIMSRNAQMRRERGTNRD